MTFKNVFSVLTVLALSIQGSKSLAQDWRSFANVDRYAEANLKLSKGPADDNRVVFMGDSITEGWGYFDPEFFEGSGYINRGIGGQTTPQMLLRFRPDVIELEPKVVVILAGTNDLAGNTGVTDVQTIADNIMSMSEIADHNGIRVIIASVLPAIDFPWKSGLEPASKIVKLNLMLQLYAQEHNFIYLDYYSSLVDEEGGLKVPDYTGATDLVHPNKLGYVVMEKLANQAIQAALAAK